MPRKPRTPRPSEIVMDEFADEQIPWDLDEHLNGCLAGYQTDPNAKRERNSITFSK